LASSAAQPLAYESVAPTQENTLSYDQSKIDKAESDAQDKEIEKLTAEATATENGASPFNKSASASAISAILALIATLFLSFCLGYFH
jgi:hypothetical protein